MGWFIFISTFLSSGICLYLYFVTNHILFIFYCLLLAGLVVVWLDIMKLNKKDICILLCWLGFSIFIWSFPVSFWIRLALYLIASGIFIYL